MAAQYYMSANDGDIYSKDVEHAGTSSTATDLIELRIGDGTTIPGQRQVLNVLKRFERWIIQNGLDGAGANLPANRGS